eukprot:symbB.v1.2.000120.t1/scaffold15.1/size524077/11
MEQQVFWARFDLEKKKAIFMKQLCATLRSQCALVCALRCALVVIYISVYTLSALINDASDEAPAKKRALAYMPIVPAVAKAPAAQVAEAPAQVAEAPAEVAEAVAAQVAKAPPPQVAKAPVAQVDQVVDSDPPPQVFAKHLEPKRRPRPPSPPYAPTVAKSSVLKPKKPQPPGYPPPPELLQDELEEIVEEVNNDDSWGDWCSTGKRLTDADNDASWGSWGSRGTSNTWPSASDGGSYDYDNGNWSISTKQEGKRNIPDKTWVDRDWQWPDQYGSRRH